MTFMDKVGDVFGKAGGGIGTAWTAATDNVVGDAIGKVTSPLTGAVGAGVGGVAEGLSTAYSYGVARPTSMFLQWQDWSKTFDKDYWRQNWNRSEDISVGQAAAINVDQMIGIGPEWTKAENDPFGNQNKKARSQYFTETNQGQLMSGAFDLIANIYGDPVGLIGKGGKAVLGADKATELAKATKAMGEVTSKPLVAPVQSDEVSRRLVTEALQSKAPKPSPLLDDMIARSPQNSESSIYAYDFPIANLKVGDEVEAGSYIRGRAEPATPEVFIQQQDEDFPTLFKINTDPGAPVLDTNTILSDDPNILQSEDLILGRGSKLKVTNDSVQEVLDPTGQPMQARVLEAQLVDSPYKPEYGKDRWGRQISKIFLETDGKTSTEIAQNRYFRDLPDAGAIGYFMSRANELYPGSTEFNTTRRHQVKADVLGVAMGDAGAIERIKSANSRLAEEYAKMGDSVPAADLSVGIRWDKNNQAVMSMFGDRAGKLDQRTIDDMGRQQVMYDRLLTNQGPNRAIAMGPSLEGVKARVPNAIKSKMDAYKLTEGFQPNGLGGTAVRFVVGNAQTRVPGSVAIRETERGREDMLNTLSAVRHMDSKTKKQLAANYVNAQTDSARINAVKQAEQEIFDSYARKYNVSPALAREVLTRINGHRDTWKGYLGSKVYTALDADMVDMYDPLDDVRHLISKPLALSQTENHVQMLDPRLLDKTFKAVSGNRFLERMARKQDGPKGAEAIGKALDKTDVGKELLDQVLGTYTRAWKDAMLFRAAYPLRNQVDNQARLMASIGMMQTMMSLGSTTKGAFKWMLEAPDKDNKSILNLFKGDQSTMAAASRGQLLRPKDTYKGYGPKAMSPALDEAELYAIVGKMQSTGGGNADLGRETMNKILSNVRGTGEWKVVDPGDPEWYPAWQRAVRQIGASPVLTAAAKTSNADALVEFMRTNPAAKREWVELSSQYDDAYEYAERAIAHVNMYLPTDELKGIVTRNTEVLGDGDVARNVGKMLKDTGARDKQGMNTDALTKKIGALTPKRDQFKAEYDAAKQERELALKNLTQTRAQYKIPRAKDFRSTPKGKRRTPEQVAADRAAFVKAKKTRETAVQAASKAAKQALEKKQSAQKKFNGVSSALSTHTKNLKTSEQLERNVTITQMQSEMPEDWRKGSFHEAEKYFADGENRMPVHGENFAPNKINPVSALAEKIRKNWYQLAADMPETVMGRSPLYRHAFQTYMREAIDNLGDDGMDMATLTSVRRGADVHARKQIAKVLYDSTNASNAADALKYISPFFAAWQDSMTKWAGLIYEDPKVGSLLARAVTAPERSGFVTDENGNVVTADGKFLHDGKEVTDKKLQGKERFVTLPGWATAGMASRITPGEDGSFKINKKNLNILFQGDPPWLPGVGPLVQIPTNEISKSLFPEAVGNNAVLRYVLPYGITNDSVAKQAIVPSWAKQAQSIFGDTKDHANTYTALQAQEWDKYARGERKTKPTADEIKKMTRNWYILRSALSNAAPVAITPVPGNQLYLDKAREYKKTYGLKWQDKFYEDFDGYFYSSQSLSQDNTGIQATLEGFDRTKQYRKQINNNPEMGWFFVGGDNLNGTFDSNIYTWQQGAKTDNGKTFRDRRSPQEALTQSNEQLGWIQYSKMATAIDLELEKRGLRSITQKGAEDLAAVKDGYIDQLQTENTDWGVAYNTRDDSKMLKLVSTAREMWNKDPEFAKRDDQVALQSYLEARTQIQAILQSREVKDIDRDENADIKQLWDAYTSYLKADSIGFGQIYDRVLEHSDDLSRSI